MTTLPPGLYGIADAAFGNPVETARALVAAGCQTIQLRAKHSSKSEIESAAAAIRTIVSDGLLIVNDHIDVAAAVGADGVHLGQDDAPFSMARKLLGPGAIIGLSTHTIAQVRNAQHASYIGFGPIFETRTKLHADAPTGLETLRAVVAMSRVPVVAIGGITATTIRDVQETGVQNWAVISAIATERDVIAAAKRFLIKP